MTTLTRNSLDEFGQKMLWISWSRLYTWMHCEQKAVFQMQGKGDEVKDLRNFVHGVLADRSVRRWLDQDEPQIPGQMDTYVDELWSQYAENSDEGKVFWKGDPTVDKEKVRTLAKEVVNNVEPFLLARVIPYEYEAELRFEIPVKLPTDDGKSRTVVLNGGADIVVREPSGNIFIYDLKATRNESYVNNITGQLVMYQILSHLLLDVDYDNIYTAFLTPACEVQKRDLDISSQDRQNLMSKIISFANFVWNDQEPTCVENKNDCWGCPMTKICPKYANVITPSKDGKNRVSILGSASTRAKTKVEK